MKYNLFKIQIVGIIDQYGAVHSKVVKDIAEENHGSCFPCRCFHRWRWGYQSGLKKSMLSSEFTDEDWDKIRRHLTKKYTIKFWDNGYHDIDDIMKRFKDE